MENNQPLPASAETSTESIFTEQEFSMQGYDKHIREARNGIYVVAGLLTINLIVYAFNIPEGYEYFWIDFAIWSAFIAGFIFLAVYTKKKPYTAIVGALCLYAAFIILNAVIDVSTLYKGILFKIITVVLLVKGLNNAKEAQEMQDSFKPQNV